MRKYVLRSQMVFISALQMLILGDVGLQIRLSGDSFMVEPARLDLQSDRNEYKHF